jgi:hypothetical protein
VFKQRKVFLSRRSTVAIQLTPTQGIRLRWDDILRQAAMAHNSLHISNFCLDGSRALSSKRVAAQRHAASCTSADPSDSANSIPMAGKGGQAPYIALDRGKPRSAAFGR